MSKTMKITVSILLSLIMVFSLLTIVPITVSAAPSEPSEVTFDKVTDASQITEENIGKCTDVEAQAWILANWDEVTNTEKNSLL